MVYNNIIYNKIVIEATRRCNMRCPHCLRGDAQNTDLSTDIADKFLINFRNKVILELFFTGGEPTLCPDVIDLCLSKCLEYDIFVGSIGFITNGKNISSNFISMVNKWLRKGFVFDFEVSIDDYHEPLSEQDISRLNELKDLGCVVGIISEGASKDEILNLGRAKKNNIGVCLYKRNLSICSYYNYLFIPSVISLTCRGEVLFSCDYEFDAVDDIYLCNYTDSLSKVIYKTGVNTRLGDIVGSGYFYRSLDRLKREGKLKLS